MSVMLGKNVALAGVGVCVVGAAVWISQTQRPARTKELPASQFSTAQRVKPDEIADRLEVLNQLDAKAKSPQESDQVAKEKVKLAYTVAKSEGYSSARKVLVSAIDGCENVKDAPSDLTPSKEEALYQSIVCLEGAGNKDQAIEQYRAFLKERPKSRLARLCFLRLTRLGQGENNASDVDLMNRAVRAQEYAIQVANSMCGPLCVLESLRLFNIQGDLKQIQAISGQDDRGATLDGLTRAYKSYGIQAQAMELNAKDYIIQPTPYILLATNHYILVKSRVGNSQEVYDPLTNEVKSISLPKETDAKFRAVILTISKTNSAQ